MDPKDSIEEKRSSMERFLDEIARTKRENESIHNLKNTRGYKINVINKEKENAKESCASALISKLYRDALPLDRSYKNGFMQDLDDGVNIFIKQRSPKGALAYITESKKNGSKPAAAMLEAVENYVNKYFDKFFESLDDVEAEDIKMDMDDQGVKDDLEQISIDLNHDEISEIIRNNVEATVQNERRRTEEEDARLKEIEERLAGDESIQTESALDAALAKEGLKQTLFKPSLFTGIMINKMNLIQEAAEDLDDEHCQKKAFFESVKEFTKWSMASVMNFEKFSGEDIAKLGDAYARMKM